MNYRIAVIVCLALFLISSTVFAQRGPTVPGTRVGDIFLGYEDFDNKTLNGKSITTKDFKGKYVFIDFWAVWCGPCEGEFPYLARVESKLVGEKFMMFGISLDYDVKEIAPFKKKYGVTYQNIADGKGWESPWAKKYGIGGIPSNFLLDPEGKIIARNLRGYQVEYEVAKALNVESAVVYFIDSGKALDNLEDEKRIEKAKELADKAIELEPDNPDALFAVGNILFAQDENAEAREWYDKALGKMEISHNPYLVYSIYKKIGESYAKEEDWDSLLSEYDKFSKKAEGQDKISLKFFLLKILDTHGQKEEALKQRKEVLVLFDKQDETFKKRNASFKKKLADEIEQIEDELKGTKEVK